MRDFDRLQSEVFQEAEFVEYDFGDPDTATAAERYFPTNVVNSGMSLAIRLEQALDMGNEIETELRSANMPYKLKASDLTEADMWPEWPEDEEQSTTLGM